MAKNVLQRLAEVQKKVDYVQKEKKLGMRYSIVSHDAVTAKVRPLMVEHGVLYYPLTMDMTQAGNRTQMAMTVRFVNVDEANDYIDVVTAGYGIDDQDKGPGKAMSYAVKYALLKCLGLESGDDPDQDQDSTFKPVTYADPPRKASGLPADGFKPDGSRSAYALKKEMANSPDNWTEFERELLEASNVTQLQTLAKAWSFISERDKWPHEWRELAKEKVNDRKEELKNHVPEDDFPGDRP